MPETRRRYTWTVHFDDPLMAREVAQLVWDTSLYWESARKWLTRPEVAGTLFGVMQVSITVRARDQWAVHRRATYFAAAVAAKAKVTLKQMGPPVPEKLPPHTNRGRYRWLAQSSLSTG